MKGQQQAGSRKDTPRVSTMRVVPVAGRDSMLLNLSGAHWPFFTRNIVILTDTDGNTGVGEVWILESGGKVCSSNRLGHGDSRLTGHSSVAVGHVGGRFFRMSQYSFYTDSLHLYQRPAENGRHIEDVVHTEIGERFCDQVCTGHFPASCIKPHSKHPLVRSWGSQAP